jgi:hypothetical protein
LGCSVKCSFLQADFWQSRAIRIHNVAEVEAQYSCDVISVVTEFMLEVAEVEAKCIRVISTCLLGIPFLTNITMGSITILKAALVLRFFSNSLH